MERKLKIIFKDDAFLKDYLSACQAITQCAVGLPGVKHTYWYDEDVTLPNRPESDPAEVSAIEELAKKPTRILEAGAAAGNPTGEKRWKKLTKREKWEAIETELAGRNCIADLERDYGAGTNTVHAFRHLQKKKGITQENWRKKLAE